MSRFLWISLILLVVSPQWMLAQEETRPDCSTNMPPEIAASTLPNYNAACQTFLACYDEGVEVGVCQVRALMHLREGCADASCETEAILGAAAVRAWGFTSYTEDYQDVSQEVWQVLGDGLIAFRAQDYQGALAAYQSLPANLYGDPMIFLSSGLIYETLGDSTKALNQYDQAAQIWYAEPLIYYPLGSLNAREGRTQEAAIDFHLMAHYLGDDAVSTALVSDLTSAYPLDTIVFEDGFAYPVFGTGGGPGGSSRIDETLTDPRPIKWAWIDGQSTLVVQNVSDLLWRVFNDLPPFWILKSSDGETYDFRVSYWDDYGMWGGALQLNKNAVPITVTENILVFEGIGSSDFLITPAGQPDPRALFALPHCPGAALSRLKVGDTGFTNDFGGSPALYDEPAGANTITPFFSHFTVLDGPRCADNQAWWQVTTDGGDTGWISESRPYGEGSIQYMVYPDEDTPIPPFCDVTLPPRLVIGGRGSVMGGQGANHVRAAPSLSAAEIGSLPEGAVFEVLMGPVCADGYAWWQVQSDDLIGWTAESGDDGYWLEMEAD